MFDGEVSGGNLGPAVKLGTRYQQTKDTQHYLSYAFDNEHEREYGAMHQRRGTLVSGIKSRMSDSASVYLEDRYQHGDASGLSRAMGLNFSPSDRWTLGANWGFGTLVDHDTNAETDRNAGGARLSYGFDELHLSSGVEYRKDDDGAARPDLERTRDLAVPQQLPLPGDAERAGAGASSTTRSATAHSATSSTASTREARARLRLPSGGVRPGCTRS